MKTFTSELYNEILQSVIDGSLSLSESIAFGIEYDDYGWLKSKAQTFNFEVVSNLLKDLSKTQYDFDDFMENYDKSNSDLNQDRLYSFLSNKQLLSEIFSKDEIKSFVNSDKSWNLRILAMFPEYIEELIKEKELTFAKLIEKYENVNRFHSLAYNQRDCLSYLIRTEVFGKTQNSNYLELDGSLVSNLIEQSFITQQDFSEFVKKLAQDDVIELLANQKLLDVVLNSNFMTFQEFLDNLTDSTKECSNIRCGYSKLSAMLRSDLFGNLLKSNTLAIDDLKYLLNRINTLEETDYLCSNITLIKKMLNEFLFNESFIDKANTLIKAQTDFHDVFDLIDFRNRDNEEILKLIELHKFVYDFDLTRDQKLKVFDELRTNDAAKNRLSYIIENQLGSNYDFDSLIKYLKKKEKKISINI